MTSQVGITRAFPDSRKTYASDAIGLRRHVCVTGLRYGRCTELLFQNTGLAALTGDLAVLGVFSVVTMGIAAVIFRRSL